MSGALGRRSARLSVRISVVGSCNLDQVFSVAEAPGPGVTVISEDYFEEAGGKGLNQALAAARAGAEVAFIGAVGDDDAGRLVRQTLAGSGVNTDGLRQAGLPTGRAAIVVDATHENRIVLLGGANSTVASLTPQDRATIAGGHALILQLELPPAVALEAARVAAAHEVTVALTPAPIQPLADGLLEHTSILFVNEPELAALTGTHDLSDGLRALLERVPAAVVTRGASGSDYADRSGRRCHCPALAVDAVDTTAAGDVYAGVFMTVHAADGDLEEAMRRATSAASLAVQVRGTSGSIPVTHDGPRTALG